jgi:mannose-6-phosphate isomerase
MSDNSILVIKGALKDYAWGKVNGLQNWVAKTDQPQAELWFGGHPSGKSIDKKTNKELSTNANFPLLIKLLCANEPLSIQVHPDKQTAESGMVDFEESEKILSDDNGKDEMLFALEEFQAFAGVESKAKRDVVFKLLFEKTNAKELKEVLTTETFFDAADIIFEIDKSKIIQINKEVAGCIKQAKYPSKAISTFEKIVSKYPNDPGVLVCLLMQFHVLEKGHAIHVSPGTPHSYVQGLAVEVMTTSDNVLRMGLTNKYVNIDAALSLVEEKQIQVLSLPTNDGVHVYKPESNFELVVVDNATYQSRDTKFAGVLNLEGETKIVDGSTEISLEKGEVALISNIDVKVVVKGHAVVARTV